MWLWGVIWDSILIIYNSSTLRLLGPRVGQKGANLFKGFHLSLSLWKLLEGQQVLVAPQLPGWYHKKPILQWTWEDQTNIAPLPAGRVDPLLCGKHLAAASRAITLQENLLPNNLVFIYSETKKLKAED